MTAGTLPINWFDLLVLMVLCLGLVRGKKRGISEEMLDVFQWLVIVVVAALYYRPLGKFISDFTHLNLLASYMGAYVFLAVGIKLLFSWVKRMVGEKLVHSDVFGRGEYFLGMLAGALRMACILVVILSLLNAKYVSPAQLAAEAKMQRENFGTISFPTLGSVQQAVFVQSTSGTFVKRYLADQLITPTEYTGLDPLKTPSRRSEMLVDEVIQGKSKP